MLNVKSEHNPRILDLFATPNRLHQQMRRDHRVVAKGFLSLYEDATAVIDFDVLPAGQLTSEVLSARLHDIFHQNEYLVASDGFCGDRYIAVLDTSRKNILLVREEIIAQKPWYHVATYPYVRKEI